VRGGCVPARMKTGPPSQGEHLADIRGIRLWYHVRGRGPPMLFQPGGAGWGGDITPYIEGLKGLEKHRTMIYLEPRGIGRSQRLRGRNVYALREYVAETEALRVHLGIPKLSLAGHSYGGAIAISYALAYPQRVEKLLLLDTSPSFQLSDDEAWMKRRRGYQAADREWKRAKKSIRDRDELARAYMRIWIPVLHFHDYSKVAVRFDEILSKMIESSEPWEYWCEHEYLTFDVTSVLKGIDAPTLIVVGDDEMPRFKQGSMLLRDRIPNSKLAIIKRCGHWPMIEHPREFLRATESFLQ
jgi:proline iminopeptidase